MSYEQEVKLDVTGANSMPTVREFYLAFSVCALEVTEQIINQIDSAALNNRNLENELKAHVALLAISEVWGRKLREEISAGVLAKLNPERVNEKELHDKLQDQLPVVYELGIRRYMFNSNSDRGKEEYRELLGSEPINA